MNVLFFKRVMSHFKVCPKCKDEYYQLNQNGEDLKIDCKCGFNFHYNTSEPNDRKYIKNKIKKSMEKVEL